METKISSIAPFGGGYKVCGRVQPRTLNVYPLFCIQNEVVLYGCIYLTLQKYTKYIFCKGRGSQGEPTVPLLSFSINKVEMYALFLCSLSINIY